MRRDGKCSPSFVAPVGGGRYAVFRITPECFLLLFSGGIQHWRVVKHGLPKNATVIDVQMNGAMFEIVLKHRSFEFVREGKALPSSPNPVIQNLRNITNKAIGL